MKVGSIDIDHYTTLGDPEVPVGTVFIGRKFREQYLVNDSGIPCIKVSDNFEDKNYPNVFNCREDDLEKEIREAEYQRHKLELFEEKYDNLKKEYNKILDKLSKLQNKYDKETSWKNFILGDKNLCNEESIEEDEE